MHLRIKRFGQQNVYILGEYNPTLNPATQTASHNSKYEQYKHSQLCIPSFIYSGSTDRT